MFNCINSENTLDAHSDEIQAQSIPFHSFNKRNIDIIIHHILTLIACQKVEKQ